MAWRRPGDKPLSESMMVSLPTHICITRPQWVNLDSLLNRPLPSVIETPRYDINNYNAIPIFHHINEHIHKLECGTWYHHPRRLQCVLSRNLRIFKVATWHYRCRHNLKNNCIWDNLQYCLLVPRSPSKPVMLTIDLQSRKVLFIEIVFWHL